MLTLYFMLLIIVLSLKFRKSFNLFKNTITKNIKVTCIKCRGNIKNLKWEVLGLKTNNKILIFI